MSPGFFITATGTGCGKTFFTRALARSIVRQGHRVSAIKPLETGVVSSIPGDAQALARACGQLDLARAPGLFRAHLPLAPYAACLEAGLPPPNIAALTARIAELASGSDVLLVEGAGGLLVPLDQEHTVADLATALGLPLLVVVPDQLGVLSHVLSLVESAERRLLRIAAVIMSQHAVTIDDPSNRTNARILREHLSLPLFLFPSCPDDDELLADAAQASGVTSLLDLAP